MLEHPYSNAKVDIKPLSLTSSFLLYPDELARIVATPLRLCEKFGLRGFILKFPFAFVLDRIYRIDRIKSVGGAINSVFVHVLKRSRAEIDQESIIYSRRIEIVY